jgi:MFS family permease
VKRIYLIAALHASVHAPFLGSKVIVSLLALKLGADASMVGLLIGCYAVPPLLLGVLAGRLVDRIGMRVPMLIGAACIGSAMVMGYLWNALYALFAVAALVGIGFVMFMIAVQNLVGALEGNRSTNYSILTIGYSVSNFVGPMVAGYAIEYIGHVSAFMVFAFFPVPAILTLAIFGALTRVAAPPAPEKTGSARELLRMGPLRRTIMISGLQMAAWELYIFFIPVYGYSISLSPSTIGNILASFAVATFVIRFALPALTRRYAVESVLSVAMLTAGAASLVIPFAQNVAVLMAASVFIGLGLGCGHPLSLTLSFERSPRGRSGEVAGVRVTVTNFARVAVPVLSGTFGAVLGPAAVFVMDAVILAGTGWLARHIDT